LHEIVGKFSSTLVGWRAARMRALAWIFHRLAEWPSARGGVVLGGDLGIWVWLCAWCRPGWALGPGPRGFRPVGAPASAGGGQRPQGGDRLVGEAGPGVFLIQGQHRRPAVSGECGGDREQS